MSSSSAYRLSKPVELVREFLRLEAAGGLVLIAAAALAILFASTALEDTYHALQALPVAISFGNFGIAKPLLHWVNDGLMALFFFLVGMEIKREILRGELSTIATAALPIIAAVGGMVVPALIYLAIAGGDPETARGWAIPAATDIAFALGVMALAGSRVPPSLKILLAALAVIDDLGAIIIIAVFYTADLSWISLAMAGGAALALLVLNRAGVKTTAPYVLVGMICWIAVLKSGVHATLAGVITAMAIPMEGGEGKQSPLEHLEHVLHPWIAFGVLPLFAFLNAGMSMSNLDPAVLVAPVTMGVALGLFAGKQLGVFGAIFLSVKTGIVPKPEGAGWGQIYGLACLAGIGFTMSLFIGELAFPLGGHEAELRLGVLSASVVSAVLGYGLLFMKAKKPA